MRRSDQVRLFQTLPHGCGYYADRTAQNLVLDPAAPNLDQLYGPALERGFRRAGGHLYACRVASTWKTSSRTAASVAA
jgi:arginyl-tRNA--protein-N-Asp/Glu arginylyltransferase